MSEAIVRCNKPNQALQANGSSARCIRCRDARTSGRVQGVV